MCYLISKRHKVKFIFKNIFFTCFGTNITYIKTLNIDILGQHHMRKNPIKTREKLKCGK